MTVPPTNWQMFVDVIQRPIHLLQGLIEYFQAWLFTLERRALYFGIPVVLIMVSVIALVGYGAWMGDGELLKRYLQWSDAEAAAAPIAARAFDTRSLLKDEPVSSYAEMLLRRILQLEKSNPRSTFLIAAQLAKRGGVSQSRQMMRRIASKSAAGFPPAHAWLAAERIVRVDLTDRSQKLALLHDLEIGCTWEGVNPVMRSALCDLLESEGKIGEAIAALTEAVKQDPDLNIKLANVAHRNGRIQPFERAAGEVKRIVQERIAADEAKSSDFASLANVFLLEGKADIALQLASEGLKHDSQDAGLMRMASETYRFKYSQSLRSSGQVSTLNLALLDAAIKADPTNPAVAQEVARIMSLGETTAPELEEVLKQQLVNGHASVMTHVLLATHATASGKIETAIQHLELALRAAPNCPLLLNNLALAIARTGPEDLSKAAELADRAVKLSRSPEYLETQGQIRMLRGDQEGAIPCFESAIQLDPARLSTRRQLVTAYLACGNEDLSKAQQAEIEKLEAQNQTSTEPSLDR